MTLTEIFIEIIQIDSESGNEKEMSTYIQNFLLKRNISFEVQKDFQIIAKIPAQKKREPKHLMFCAHLDTVSPGKNIKPILHEKNNENQTKITSDGKTILGADNKACVANLLYLVDQIYKKNITECHHIELIFTVREEVDDPGVYEMDFENVRADVGFIFDKANEEKFNTVVSVASSISDFTIFLKGKGAHAGSPELGINALEMLVDYVSQLHLGRPYPNSSLNIGIIEGGESTNTIPSQILLSGDFRAEDPEYMKKIENDLLEAKNKTLQNERFKDANIDINIVIYCKGYSHNTQSKAFTRLSKIYSELGYDGLRTINVQMGSDASCFMNDPWKAIETFCLTDGCFDVHTVEEWTTVENLEKIQSVMQEVVKKW